MLTVEKATTLIAPVEGALRGAARVPGDKSISHRVVIFSAMAEGTTRVSGLSGSEDVRSSIRAVEQLGARMSLRKNSEGAIEGTITGWGRSGPLQPDRPVDCGNSGTTARLLMGVLASWDRDVTLTGDASLRRRPMRRVTEPLASMGARFSPEGRDALPLAVHGTSSLRSISYDSPIASAQVKSAILLAGIRACGITRVTEPAASRNHTESMLASYGIEAIYAPRLAEVHGPSLARACGCAVVPGDPSSAAFLASAATLIRGSSIVIEGVSLNPARIGFVRILERMGGDVRCVEKHCASGEPVGDIFVEYADGLRACGVAAEEIASLVDEVPVLSFTAAFARGVTVFRGIGELRVKESDRAAAIVEGLSSMGVRAWLEEDDLFIEGKPGLRIEKGLVFNSHGDHRLAMTWALAGIVSGEAVTVRDFASVAVSYPDFLKDVYALGGLSVK